MQMTLFGKRRVAIAVALTTAAIAVPAGSAHAAPFPTFKPTAFSPTAFSPTAFNPSGWGFPAAGWGSGLNAAGWAGTPSASLSFIGPSIGQVAAVIGPTIITTAPSTFINTNNQVSAGSAVSGGQVSGAAGGNG
jgi:hypothetical protein